MASVITMKEFIALCKSFNAYYKISDYIVWHEGEKENKNKSLFINFNFIIDSQLLMLVIREVLHIELTFCLISLWINKHGICASCSAYGSVP